ncbi:uncharacterized protein BDZ99DRAFT_369459, partial [Mytilinidion resinicola]
GCRPRCTIKHVSLDDDPRYAALSYVWGPPSNERFMIVEKNDEQFRLPITSNLNSALSNIDKEGYLWVDAICINQTDDIEKTWQVQQMWNIFPKADHTAAWLGRIEEE